MSLKMESLNTLFEKEELKNLEFSNIEVIENEVDRKARTEALNTAMILGNSYKSKVKIFFTLRDGNEGVVETTVWHAGDSNVSLKGEILIPTHAIRKVSW